MKSTLLIIAVAFLSISVYADGNKTDKNEKTNITEVVDNVKMVQISGTVTDKKSHESLAGAAIFVNGVKYYSDLDGNFIISDITPGKYTVKVELISYQPVEMEIEVQTNQKISIDLVQA